MGFAAFWGAIKDEANPRPLIWPAFNPGNRLFIGRADKIIFPALTNGAGQGKRQLPAFRSHVHIHFFEPLVFLLTFEEDEDTADFFCRFLDFAV